MIDIANLFVSLLSAVGTLVQAYNSSKDISNKKIKQSKERASTTLKIGGKEISEVIDEGLLNTYVVRIQQEHNSLINILENKESTHEEIETAIKSSKKSICFFLNEIKDQNIGILPTVRLKKLWKSNQCKA